MLGVVAQVPCLPHRQMCLPVLARLWHPKQQPQRTKLVLARELVELVAAHLPNRTIHLVGDAAYAGSTLRGLPGRVTTTTRLRADAALYGLPPARTPGQRGRPRLKGDRLPELIVWAALVATSWQTATVACYGRRKQLELTSRICSWYTVWHTQPVRILLARTPGASDGYDLALVSTDLDASPQSCSNGTRPAGVSSRRSLTPATYSAPARPATEPVTRSSAPSRSDYWP